jgi:hypothetical protein
LPSVCLDFQHFLIVKNESPIFSSKFQRFSDTMVQKLQVAVSGLGRMGARHALHFVGKTPRANLVAACDPSPKCRQWAEKNLVSDSIQNYMFRSIGLSFSTC